MNERNKPHICKNCIHNQIYGEFDDNMEYTGKLFYVCMLTDADVEPDDTCHDFEDVDGYTPDTDSLLVELL